MFQSLILLLLFIGIFRFMMRFVLPIARVGSAVHRQMKHMQQATNGRQEEHAHKSAAPKKSSVGEYIDYEEVR